MKKIILFAAILFIAQLGYTQAVFISKAKIEFERKINVWANIKGDFAEQFRRTVPQYKTDYFNFEFDGNTSIYQPGRESNESRSTFFGASPGADNIVFSDHQASKYIAKKNVFEKTYLIEDSLRNATWKITNDFREIAGFNCRRATTIIMDSVFVVAFYTDEILIPGGPESFGGLPGMILGLVINRVHSTWYATKVELTNVNTKAIVPPTRGSKITTSDLSNTLRSSFSNWGSEADRNAWWIML